MKFLIVNLKWFCVLVILIKLFLVLVLEVLT